MPPQRDSRLHADDILQAIANIEADTAGVNFEEFAADRRVRQLGERNLEIISEASRRLPSLRGPPNRIFPGADCRDRERAAP